VIGRNVEFDSFGIVGFVDLRGGRERCRILSSRSFDTNLGIELSAEASWKLIMPVGGVG